MKAAIFQGIGKALEVVTLPDPEPAPEEVILRVGRCGICGSDLHLTETESVAPKAGSVIGHEYAGEIVAIGRDVSNFKVGDRVTAMALIGCGKCAACLAGEPAWCVNGVQHLHGGYAQYARAGMNECLRLPTALSDTDGALVEPLAVALHGVRMTPGLAGARVMIIGAGPIGLGVVFWARRFGAASIEVVEPSPARGDMALGLGADKILQPRPVSNKLEGPPRGVELPDYVFECVGKPGLLAAAVSHVRPRGTVVSLGFCMAPEQVVAAVAAVREVTMKFPILYSYADYRETLDALSSGAVEPRLMVTDVVSLEQLPKRFESLRKPSHSCKIMIDPWLESAAGG